VDETGWSTWGEKRTLWTASTPRGAVFRVADDRHRDRLSELTGESFQGIVRSIAGGPTTASTLLHARSAGRT
jgi:hypothetical protein